MFVSIHVLFFDFPICASSKSSLSYKGNYTEILLQTLQRDTPINFCIDSISIYLFPPLAFQPLHISSSPLPPPAHGFDGSRRSGCHNYDRRGSIDLAPRCFHGYLPPPGKWRPRCFLCRLQPVSTARLGALFISVNICSPKPLYSNSSEHRPLLYLLFSSFSSLLSSLLEVELLFLCVYKSNKRAL